MSSPRSFPRSESAEPWNDVYCLQSVYKTYKDANNSGKLLSARSIRRTESTIRMPHGFLLLNKSDSGMCNVFALGLAKNAKYKGTDGLLVKSGLEGVQFSRKCI